MRIGALLVASLFAAALAVSAAPSAHAAILVNIDKNAQRMTVAVDGETRYVWPVSTGRRGYDTPNGTFKVNRMDADHLSQEWDNAPMPHTMFFDMRGHAIHGFSDVKHLGLPVSHGCVRLAPTNAATLFALVQAQSMKETTVVVSGEAPAGSGQEMVRRRAPAQEAAAQPPVPPPGYDGYQPEPPRPYDAQGYYRPQPPPAIPASAAAAITGSRNITGRRSRSPITASSSLITHSSSRPISRRNRRRRNITGCSLTTGTEATGSRDRPLDSRGAAAYRDIQRKAAGVERPRRANPRRAKGCNALLIYPRFEADTFWNFTRTAEVFGAKYPAPPLGLITLAALLPPSWSLRLVNRNTEELSDDDLDWADLVLTGGMLPQGGDTLDVIDLCRARGKPVAVGGPSVTSTPDFYRTADFRILGEAEGIIDTFVEAWEAGAREGVFEAEKFQVDVTKSPIPRFDLLKFDDYLHIGVQFSRGCPFTCEFCDIIELYGRVPRAKTNAQMLAELDELYRLGYRGHVDFVDDNLIGNKKAVKAFLPELATWLDAHDCPFEFTTEASINLADDAELLRLLNRANFVGVFIGIESPDPATLIAMRKKQNTRRNIAESIHKVYAAGLFVTAGFIIGFDTETRSMADAMIDLIEEAAIPVCMVGLLYALPNTQLTRRLEAEGRLHPFPERANVKSADQCTMGLNFTTLRPRQEILADYVHVLERIYDPAAYAGRLLRLTKMLDNSGRKQQRTRAEHSRHKLGSLEIVHRIMTNLPEPRDMFRRTLTQCMASNPASIRWIVAMMALYLHVGPYSRDVIGRIEAMATTLEPAAEHAMAERSMTEPLRIERASPSFAV